MLIRLKKTRDGVVLSVLSGARPAQVQRSGHAGFFAAHDLMHYAVETTFPVREGFFGLLARGWDIAAFSDHDDPRYQAMPAEAVVVERLVDAMTRACGDPAWRDRELVEAWLDEAHREVASIWREGGAHGATPTRGQVLAVCNAYSRLLERWAKTPVGEHLELEFRAPESPPTRSTRGDGPRRGAGIRR
jgi:hypothetical protein